MEALYNYCTNSSIILYDRGSVERCVKQKALRRANPCANPRRPCGVTTPSPSDGRTGEVAPFHHDPPRTRTRNQLITSEVVGVPAFAPPNGACPPSPTVTATMLRQRELPGGGLDVFAEVSICFCFASTQYGSRRFTTLKFCLFSSYVLDRKSVLC